MSTYTATTRASRLLVVTVLVGVVVLSAHQSYTDVPITVNGTAVSFRRGAEVGDAVRSSGELHHGRMLAAADQSVLSESAGLPATVLVNGRISGLSAALRRGDCIVTIPGADVVEPLVEETRTVGTSTTTLGVGPDEKVVSAGSPGLVVLRIGSVSGQVVATETVAVGTPALVRRIPAPGTGLVALTFDDGPWPGQTEAILSILEQRNVPATFFMLGSRVRSDPELARAVAFAGHAVGNHTFWHVHLNTAAPDVAWWEIEATNQIIEEATGARPAWLRAPGGLLGGPAHAYIGQSGMRSALWTIDPQDWREGVTPEDLAWSVIAAAHPGAIVVLHDGGGNQATTIAALPMIIDGLRAYGYEFVTLDEMPEVRAGW